MKNKEMFWVVLNGLERYKIWEGKDENVFNWKEKAKTEQGRSFGKTVKEYRNRKGWTQEELAWQAEMTREQLGRIERDQCLPSVETIGRLEKALNLEPMTLLKLKIIPELCDFQMTEEEKKREHRLP